MGTVSLIGRITPAGVITEYGLHDLSAPCAITAGPDGNLWFTECNINGNAIGRITTSGVITEFMLPTSGRGYYPLAITPGSRRKPLVHGALRQQDRAHHDRWPRH